MSEQPVHNGPSGVNRVTAGTTGTLLAVVLLWALVDASSLIPEPPPQVRDAMVGLIVAVYGWAYSRFLGMGGR